MSLQWHHGEQTGPQWWVTSSPRGYGCDQGGCGNYIIGVNEGGRGPTLSHKM